MKRLIFTLIALASAAATYAQSTVKDTVITTTTTVTTTTKDTITRVDTVVRPTHNTKFSFSWKSKRDTVVAKKDPGFSAGLTLSRIDVGFATLVDNGSFTLSPDNRFLRYRSWKSSNFGFDVAQMGYRFNSSFKIYVSAGWDWTSFRLREDVTIKRLQPQLTYTEDETDYTKNTFSATYFRLPVTFDWRSKDDKDGHRFHVSVGAITGFLVNGHTKQKSAAEGTVKNSGGYNLTKFRYGPFIRAGYGGIGIFAKYYVNDMFDESPAQKGLKQLSVGATIGF